MVDIDRVGGVWYEKVPVLVSFDRGNPLGDWLPGLEPADGDIVVTKQHASGFHGTDLVDHLRRLEADSVIVVGVSTSGCVRATATDASANGFRPFVVRQAVGDRTPAVHDANLFDLQAKYADVIDDLSSACAKGDDDAVLGSGAVAALARLDLPDRVALTDLRTTQGTPLTPFFLLVALALLGAEVLLTRRRSA